MKWDGGEKMGVFFIVLLVTLTVAFTIFCISCAASFVLDLLSFIDYRKRGNDDVACRNDN